MIQDMLPSEVLQYIVHEGRRSEHNGKRWKLPPMDELSRTLGVSRGKLREQLITAQAWGAVEMRPGDGTYVRPLDFYTPIRGPVLYGVALDTRNFDRYYQLRIRLEVAFWTDATRKLTAEDKDELQRIVQRAERRLRGTPVEIPHREHRALHLLIFARLDNEFVLGLLRAYWDAYEAVGLHRYFEYGYYEEVWSSHRAMVDAIRAGQYGEGREILIQHFGLLHDRLQGAQGRE